MSYRIYLNGIVCDKCGLTPDGPLYLPDPTYNLTPIFDLALTDEPMPNLDVNELESVVLNKPVDRLRGLRLLSGKKAADTLELFENALQRLRDPARQASFRALEPDNGWGDLRGASTVMELLQKAAIAYPNHIWEIQ